MTTLAHVTRTALAAIALSACSTGTDAAPVTTYADGVAHNQIANDGTVESKLTGADESTVLASAKWSRDTGFFSIELPAPGVTVTGSLSPKASVDQLNELVHARWQDAQKAQPEAARAVSLSDAEELALFDASRDDVTPVFDTDGHQIGLANTSYGVLHVPQRGFLAFDQRQNVLWGWSAHIPSLRAPASAKVHVSSSRLTPTAARTTVCWYLNIPVDGYIMRIEDCFVLN
jgi:hypothetical protein